jgi:hypothetical protein
MTSYTTKYQIVSIGNEYDTQILTESLYRNFKNISRIEVDLENETILITYKDKSKSIKLEALNEFLTDKLGIRLSKRNEKTQYTLVNIDRFGSLHLIPTQFKIVLSAFGFALGFLILTLALVEYYFLTFNIFPGNLKIYLSTDHNVLPLFIIIGSLMYLYNYHLGFTKLEQSNNQDTSARIKGLSSALFQIGRVLSLSIIAVIIFGFVPNNIEVQLFLGLLLSVTMLGYSLSIIKIWPRRNPFIAYNLALLNRRIISNKYVKKSSIISGFLSSFVVSPFNLMILLILISSRTLERSFTIILLVEMGYLLISFAIIILNKSRTFDISYTYINRIIGYFFSLYSLLLINTYLSEMRLPNINDSLQIDSFIFLVLYGILLYILLQKLGRKIYSLLVDSTSFLYVQNTIWIITLIGLLFMVTLRVTL